MNKYVYPTANLNKQTESGARTWTIFIGLSVLCHIVFISALVFGQLYVPERDIFLPSVINVDLVSLPPAGFTESTPVKNSTKRSVKVLPVKKVKQVLKKKQVIPIKETPKVVKKNRQIEKKIPVAKIIKKKQPKKSLKSKTYNSSKIIESTRKQMKKRAEKSEDDHLDKAFSRLRIDTEKREKSGVNLTFGNNTARGKRVPEIIKLYQMELSYHIQKNWAFSERLAGNQKGLNVNILIKIMANGEIYDIEYKKKSGNKYLDDSAYRAVVKSNPLPALPKGYSSYDVVLGFTPSGLR